MFELLDLKISEKPTIKSTKGYYTQTGGCCKKTRVVDCSTTACLYCRGSK